MKEPKPRADGLCVVCEKPVPKPSRFDADGGDAFCRSRCCREFFGTQLAVDIDTPKSVLAKKKGRAL